MRKIIQKCTEYILLSVLCFFCVEAAAISERNPEWTEMMYDLCVSAGSVGTDRLARAVNNIKDCHPDQSASFCSLAGVTLVEFTRSKDQISGKNAAINLVNRLEKPEKLRDAISALTQRTSNTNNRDWLNIFDRAYNQLRFEKLAKCPRIAFVRRKSYGLRGTNGTMFSHRTDRYSAVLVYDPSVPEEQPKMVFETKEGFIWDIKPSYDGQKLLMSYKETNDMPFHIWEIGVDGCGLRQLTRGNYHDFNPVYYPDGRIVFCSSRVESYSLCQDFLASALYIMDGDGGNIRRIDFTTLCTSAPSVMPDGTILCTRWEYNDKNIFSWQGLWTINPDGRQLKLYYGNTITVPNSRYGGKPVPGTGEIMLTMAGHHLPPVADIAVVDRSKGIENPEAMRKVTFETSYKITKGKTWRDINWMPGDVYYPWSVTDPWPVTDALFLAAFGRLNENTGNGRFGICLAMYDGVRFELYGKPAESFLSPVTLDKKSLPNTIATEVPLGTGEGTFFVQNVYHGLFEQGVARGQVKALRVIRQTPKKWNTEGPRFHDHYPVVGYGSYYIKENLGEVPVDDNGSAYFTVPSNCEIYFIALDKDGKEIQRMGSVTQITSGEHVSCVGCHDDRMKAPPISTSTLKRQGILPDALRPPAWGIGPFDYVKHVQPVWDRYCVSCHSGRTPKGGVDLSGDKSRFFSMSYDYLVHRGMVEYYYINPGPTGVFPAMASGSYVSKLTALIESKHSKVHMDDESRRRVYTWIDSNIQYYNTWDMSRPHTCGGRDTWNFVKDNSRVKPEPEPWLEDFGKIYVKNCVSCHDTGPFSEYMQVIADSNDSRRLLKRERRVMSEDCPENYSINLTRPEFSRILNAHLSKNAGGHGVEKEKKGRKPLVFMDTNDLVYQEMLKAIQKGKLSLDARPRMDMPGGVMIPQERSFGKVF